MPTPIVLDCDPGHDDAIALLLALASPELDVRAVTTTHGNQTLEKTTLNALRVLELAGRIDVPVGRGADRPLVRPRTVAAHVHGVSGLDGPVLPRAGLAPVDADAVALLARVVSSSAAPVTLVPTGPLTNIARYLARHGIAGIERVVLMGGAIGLGSVTPAAEFNVYADPEAAQAVLRSGLDVTMIGLDVTFQALATPKARDRLRASGRIGTFAAELLDFTSIHYRDTYGWDGPPIHDAVAVASLLDGSLVTTRRRNVEIELGSELCRGRTVVDLWSRTGRPSNANVGVTLDAERFLTLLVERIGSLDRKEVR